MPIIVDGSMLPPPPPARIERIEESFARKFPPAYLRFLNQANGAKLKNPVIITPEREVVIERFLPIVDDPATHSEGWADVAVVASQLDARLATSEDTIGYDLIPIASLFAGDFLVLDYRHNPNKPQISLWNHETSDDFSPDAKPIASDFETFEGTLP